MVNDTSAVQPTESDINNLASVDWELAKQLVGGNANLAKDLMAIMLANLGTELEAINLAYQNNDLDNLTEQIHKLHGGCCYTGLLKLTTICRQLEQQLWANSSRDKYTSNHHDPAKVKLYLGLINKEIEYLLLNYNSKQ